MELQQAFTHRRSIRHYTDASVSRNHIEELVRAAQQAPVSCNLQLTKYIIVDDPVLIKRLEKEVSYKFSYTPCYIIVVQDTRFTIERYSGVMSAGMAVEHMLLKAVELGLATCPMAGFGRDKVLRKILQIPPSFEILLMVSVGYPDPSFIPTTIPKLSLDDVYAYNNFLPLKTINDSPRLKDHSISQVINYRNRIAAVYLDRFRLHTFDERYYRDVFEMFKKEVLGKVPVAEVLDVMSYDGFFAKLLSENETKIPLNVSDYLPLNRTFLAEKLSVKAISIDEHNTFRFEKKVNIATFIFQAEFTPELFALLRSTSHQLVENGYFFSAHVREYITKRIVKWLKRTWRRIVSGKVYNVYEHNPFYKIGPHEVISPKRYEGMLKEAGFKLEQKITIKKYLSRGVYIDIYIARSL
jgi:nitroreductase